MEGDLDRHWLFRGEGKDENSFVFIFVLPFFFI